MIRYFLCVLILTGSALSAQTPEDEVPDSFFTAVIVEDMDVSLEWYTNILNLEKMSETHLPERGLRQVNLMNSWLHVELIEIDSSISPSKALESHEGKKRVSGHFKIGFKVTNFDYWQMVLYKFNEILLEDVVRDPVSGKRTVVFTDPDGNRIQVFEN